MERWEFVLKKDRDLSRLFSKGQQLESSLSASSIFSGDGGLHLTSYKVSVQGKTTIIDNISIYGSTILVLESKNFTYLQGRHDVHFWRGRGVSRYFSVHSPLAQNEYHVKLLRWYLLEKGMKYNEFKIEHYIVVPDDCVLDIDDEIREHLLLQSQLTILKRKTVFYNDTLNPKLAKIIKEGLF